MDNAAEAVPSRAVTCKAASDPVVRLFVFTAMLLGFGIWCVMDMAHYPYKPFSEDINAFLSWAFNHFAPIILLPAGAGVLGYALIFLTRKLVADETGIKFGRQKKIPWSDIKKVDATELLPKKILTLIYGDGRKLKLDSWKLTNFKELVAYIETHAPAEASQQS